MIRRINFLIISIFLILNISLVVNAFFYKIGDEGPNIAVIQERLTSLGYELKEDGIFDEQMQDVVKKFQEDKSLIVDGVVGNKTYAALIRRGDIVSRSDMATSIARRLVSNAGAFIGTPYYFGGSTPEAFDCSGFTSYVYNSIGIKLPRAADDQYNLGADVTQVNLLPGDLVFFTTYTSGVSHTGIYLSEGEFISATSSRGVAIDSLFDDYWGPRYIGAKRLI